MSPDAASRSLSPQALVEHVDFLRALARSLVRDEHAAEDLVQDALVAGMQHGGGALRGLRGWFAVVMRHRMADGLEAEHRRAHHERAAARPEAGTPDPGVVAGQLDVQRALAEAVAELREPYRSVIFLRFYEDLAPRRIAERLDLPVATVKTQLHRGLEQLRKRLDATHEGRRERWCAALVGLLDSPRSAPLAPATGAAWWLTVAGSAMFTKLGWTVGVIVIAAGVWISARPERALEPSVKPTPTQELVGSLPAGEAPASAMSPDFARAVAEVSKPVSPTQSDDELRGWRLEGRVTDPGGAPVAGAGVQLSLFPTETIELTCDEEGEFVHDLELPEALSSHAMVELRASARVPGLGHSSFTRRLDPRTQQLGGTVRVDLELRNGPEAYGRVVDPDGRPVVGLDLHAHAGDYVIPLFGRTREDGSFVVTLEMRPQPDDWPVSLGEVTLVSASPAIGELRSRPFFPEVDAQTDVGTLMLTQTGRIHGELRFPDGRPVDGVQLRVERDVDSHPDSEAWLQTTTDEAGRFELYGLVPGAYWIRLPDFESEGRPALFGPFRTAEAAHLVLESHRLRVLVRDEQGRAVPRAELRVRGTRRSFGLRSAGLPGERVLSLYPDTWRVTARCAGAAPAVAEVVVGERDFDTSVELRLDFESERGALRIGAVNEVGEAVTPLEARLFLEGQRSPVLRNLRPDADGWLRDLPVGRYRLEVSNGEPDSARHFPVSRSVEVESGATTELEFVLKRGAWLELEIDGAGPEVEGDKLVKIELESIPEGRTTELDYVVMTKESGSRSYGGPFLGVPGRSVLLDPGHYFLRASAAGFAARELRVELRPGEGRRVSMELSPQ